MCKYISKPFFLILILIFCLAVSSYAQETRSIDELMGLSIQKYLEGDNKQSIIYLDEILVREAGHQKAKDLLEKSTRRFAEDMKVRKSYKEDMPYIEKVRKHIPDSPVIKSIMKDFRDMMGVNEEEPEKAAKKEEAPQTAPEPEKPDIAKEYAAKEAEYKRQLNIFREKLARSKKNLEVAQKKQQPVSFDDTLIRNEIRNLEEKLGGMKSAKAESSAPIWPFLVLIILGGAAYFIIYKTIKGENVNVVQSVMRDRQSVEELKNAYNKDIGELSKKLVEYGKAYQRADQLEKNWEKLINILERVTKGGSTEKVVLKDSPDGRKAVTGIDPRTRARADSVEVIAQIFRDSPKASEMIAPFLDDEDNRTRANAAVAYYRYDPVKSMLVIEDMVASDDKWMRLSAAWALGELNDPSTAKVLEKLLDDPDSQIKNRARISLENLLSDKTEDS